jgi:hypothetical protein
VSPSRKELAAFALVALSCLASRPALAQATPVQTTTGSVEPNIYPPALPLRKGPKPPGLAFRVLGEVALRGPLPEASPRLVEGKIAVATEAGIATAEPVPGASATVAPAVDPPPPAEAGSGWVLSADGRYRYRTLPEGRLDAEKLSRFGSGKWKPKWKVRLTGGTPAAPLVLEKRVCVGSLADLVTCVRYDNGHRVWATDVQDRISRPLVLWEGEVSEPGASGAPPHTAKERLILVTPDTGGNIVALDPYDGAKRATFELPEASGRIASEPVVTPAGTVAVPRQGYEASEAGITLLAVVVAPKEPAKPKTEKPVSYNDAAPGR